jgi:hypothetical protein
LYFGNEADKKIQKFKLDAGNKLHEELSDAALDWQEGLPIMQRLVVNQTSSAMVN